MDTEARLDRMERLLILLINTPPELILQCKHDRSTQFGAIYNEIVAEQYLASR